MARQNTAHWNLPEDKGELSCVLVPGQKTDRARLRSSPEVDLRFLLSCGDGSQFVPTPFSKRHGKYINKLSRPLSSSSQNHRCWTWNSLIQPPGSTGVETEGQGGRQELTKLSSKRGPPCCGEMGRKPSQLSSYPNVLQTCRDPTLDLLENP